MKLSDEDLFWESKLPGVRNVHLGFFRKMYTNIPEWMFAVELTWSEALVLLQASTLNYKFRTLTALKKTVSAVGPYFHIDLVDNSISNTALERYLHKGTVPPLDTFNPIESLPTWKKCFGRIPKDTLLWGVSRANIEKVKADGTFKIYQKALKEHPGSFPKSLWDSVAVFGVSVLSMDSSQLTNLAFSSGWEDISLTPEEQRNCANASHPALLAIWYSETDGEHLTQNEINRLMEITDIELSQVELLNSLLSSEFCRAGLRAMLASSKDMEDVWEIQAAEAISQELINTHWDEDRVPVPPITLTEGDYIFRRLDPTDPKGLFLGLWTNCCQHPSGAADSSAWSGYLQNHSGFYVIEKRGQIIAQSWAWSVDNKVVFDNIEALDKSLTNRHVLRLYKRAAEEIVALGYTQVNVGMGYTMINIPYPKTCPGNPGFITPRFEWVYSADRCADMYSDACEMQAILAFKGRMQLTPKETRYLEKATDDFEFRNL